MDTATKRPTASTMLTEMNEAYDRAAGRWCSDCGQCGSHHTDRHEEFASKLPGYLSDFK